MEAAVHQELQVADLARRKVVAEQGPAETLSFWADSAETYSSGIGARLFIGAEPDAEDGTEESSI
jgi:hypothetical protein